MLLSCCQDVTFLLRSKLSDAKHSHCIDLDVLWDRARNILTDYESSERHATMLAVLHVERAPGIERKGLKRIIK